MLKKVRIITFPFILGHFSFVRDVINFFIHSLNRFALKLTAYMLLVFFNWVPYMQIHQLNACKLSRKPILFRINSFQNQNTY